MLTSNKEILETIIITSILIIFFVIVVIIAIVRYQNKEKQYHDRELEIKNEFIKAALEAKEQTMNELSERLHGNLQQTISLAKLNLNKGLIAATSTLPDGILQTKELLIDAIAEIKNISKDLDPNYILGHTLEENIEQQLQRVSERTEIETQFDTSEEEINIENGRQTLVYRIVQEAINNCIHYAKATRICVRLKNLPKEFTISIEDNGNGFDTSKVLSKKNGTGIINMQTRTELINGTFFIDSLPNKGTRIFLKIPYHD